MLVIMAVIVALVVVLSWSVTSSFEARAMVQLAKTGSGKDVPGSQGMVVKRLQSELSPDLLVKFYPRPTNLVMIVSQADSREAAFRNAQLAADRLVQDSNKAKEYLLKQHEDHVAAMERYLIELNQLISWRMAIAGNETLEKGLLASAFEEETPVLKLLSARVELEIKISKIKNEYELMLRSAAIISPPIVDDDPFRPRWKRNIIIGVLFGLCFGLFVVFLLGVFDQLVCGASDDDKC